MNCLGKEMSLSKKRMLVTGSGGMVGAYAPGLFADYELYLTDLQTSETSKLDVVNREETLSIVKKIDPHVVLHLAAATDVDQCERDPFYAYLSNVVGTQHVAQACRENDSVMVYISTGAVFDGVRKEPFTEKDLPNPSTVYGLSKWLGEKMISFILQKYLIVRAGWMFGGGVKDKKFVGKIAQMILQGEKRLKVVDDKFGSPTYAKDLLKTVKSLLDQERFGIFHAVNGWGCSRYDVANEIKAILGANDVTIEPVKSDAFKLDAPRGFSEQLLNQRLGDVAGVSMRGWQEALKEYLSLEWM